MVNLPMLLRDAFGNVKVVMKRLIAPLIAGWLIAVPAWGQETSGVTAFAQAVELLKAGDDEGAYATLPQGNLLLRDLLIWTQLRTTGEEASFGSYQSFLSARPDWPGLSRIRSKAELAIEDATSDALILAFFENHDVETGEGAVAYARALNAAGRQAEAQAMLISVWTNDGLTQEGHQAIIDAFPNVVAPYHAARVDMLLWRWRTSDAANVVPLLVEGEQALASARIGIIERSSDARALEDLVPQRLIDAPGLQYDRFNWFADRGDWTQATVILTSQSVLARWHMREGNIETAYRTASQHFIDPSETNYADLEWISGYISMTYMRDFERALQHFERFDAAVTSPISKGRAGYWLGRAHEGLGNAEAAVAAFLESAQHQTSFYGLLSAERLGLTMDPDIAGGETFGDWRTSPILNNELVLAGLALLQAGERGTAVLFFRDAAANMSRQEVGQLGQLFMDIQEPFYAVLISKTAAREGVLVQDVYFPIHPLAQMDLPVEAALSLAIARQESEFRVDAGSSVGALGLMQLMPATAQEVAGWLDLPYSRARLTTDWEYNASLGSEYLAYLTREFGDSPVMIAAGYNAGPSRPQSWMSERGDPRIGFDNGRNSGLSRALNWAHWSGRIHGYLNWCDANCPSSRTPRGPVCNTTRCPRRCL